MELITAAIIGVVVSCSVFVASVSSLGWWKRNNLRAPDLPFLLNVFTEVCGAFANSVFCSLVFTGIFENFLLLTGFGFCVDPDRGWLLGDTEFLGWLLAVFACKCVQILWIFYRQCTLDIFIVDWEEQGKPDSPRHGCLWRTYYVANQLLRLQVARQISPVLLFSIGYLCITFIPGIDEMYVGPGKPLLTLALTLLTGGLLNSSSVIVPHTGPYYVFTISSVTLSIIAVVIYVLVGLRNRFFGNRVRELIDVCSWLNCSIFLRSYRGFAHYVHGKSVHPTAEFNFSHLVGMIRNEEANLVSRRGLNADSETQTFSFALPDQFDVLYKTFLSQLKPVEKNGGATAQLTRKEQTHVSFINSPFSTPIPPDPIPTPEQSADRTGDQSLQQRALAHDIVGSFIRRFLDHGFKEADYIIRWRNSIESFFDVETGRTGARGVMYYDPKMAFTEYFFIGRTFDLFVFEVLLFSVVAVYMANYAVATVTVLMVGFVLSKLRAFYGHSNLSRKAYVYRRFLL